MPTSWSRASLRRRGSDSREASACERPALAGSTCSILPCRLQRLRLDPPTQRMSLVKVCLGDRNDTRNPMASTSLEGRSEAVLGAVVKVFRQTGIMAGLDEAFRITAVVSSTNSCDLVGPDGLSYLQFRRRFPRLWRIPETVPSSSFTSDVRARIFSSAGRFMASILRAACRASIAARSQLVARE